MKKKCLAVAVILLFIGVAFAPSIFADVVENKSSITTNIIVVDDEGDGDFISIQNAVNNASQGDIIEVYSGTYYEYDIDIYIGGIILKGIPFEFGNGSDVGKPFINGEGIDHLLDIRAGNVTIDGFRMENKESSPYSHGYLGILGIFDDASNCTISNNDIAYTSSTLVYTQCSNTLIINNNISHSTMSKGITLREPSKDNIVRGNVISDCVVGITCWGSGNNLIERNTVQNSVGRGIEDVDDYNTIQYNLIKNCTVGYSSTGMYNTVAYNNFINNQLHASFSLLWFNGYFSAKWMGNYWGRGRILPYPILGVVYPFIWFKFDWRPALVPNEI